MSEAWLRQIKYWQKALLQAEKAIKRKNRHIKRLQHENSKLKYKVQAFMMTTSIIEFEKSNDK